MIEVVGDEILIDPPLPESKELGARWRASDKKFVLSATRMNAIMARDALPDAPDVTTRLSRSWRALDDASGTLFGYQRDVAGRLATEPHGQIVVLSPGLGKTAVAVRAADKLVPDDQVVVIAPASLLYTWKREIEKWQTVPGTVTIDPSLDDYSSRWLVTSWDKASRIPWGKGWPLWILDESVLVKSHTSKRFKSMKKLRGGIDRVWLLSGNPVTRYADDLWSQLHLVWPKAFPSYWRFADRYCITEDNPWAPHARTIVGTRRSRDVMEENSDLVIVVNQEEVLELPEYLFESVETPLAGKQAEAYRAMRDEFVAELGDGSQLVADNEIEKLVHLQQIASYWDGESAKHDALIELLPSYEPPHLVWTHWREGARALHERLQSTHLRVQHVSGEMKRKERDYFLEAFKDGHLDALVLSLGVGKFGHTFTNARSIHWIDKTWNADDYFQGLHRVRRIGLGHRPVSTTYRAPGTTDELVELNLEGKLPGISRITRANLKALLLGLGKEA